MRYGVAAALLAGVLTMSGCADDAPPAHADPEPAAGPAPAYDAGLEPAAAVLALVPDGVRSLTVTDFDEVRDELGVTTPTSGRDVAVLWDRADAERPLLTPGMLRSQEAQLTRRYGLSQLDVAWEAHFFDEADQETGWVLGFGEGTDMTKVAAAAQAPGGVLAGALVDQQQRLASRGAATDPTQSWAADPELTRLVGLPANATYLARGCVEGLGGVDVDELDGYAIAFEGSLVTARLGEGRHDLFVRMRMATDDPRFSEAFDGGVADPLTGRIGYVMQDPAAAARRALRHELPFAACA